jgi:hypothetical protein
MLPIPTERFSRSIRAHNVEIDALCDWVEGSLLFDSNREFISQIDVVDSLTDNALYDKQDFALERVTTGWLEIRSRIESSGGGLGYQLKHTRLISQGDWMDHPGHAFCLLVSLSSVYDWWVEREYAEQGEIFELLTKRSFEAQFPMWKVHQTGWSRTNVVQLRDVAAVIVDKLFEDYGDFDTWDQRGNKELGLDLLCYRPFSDQRRGIPVYLMQCASGKHWDTKLRTPDIDQWGDIIHFKNKPLRAFATPYTMPEQTYNQCIATVRGLFLDRCRILTASTYEHDWISNELKDRILTWCEPRVQQLLNRVEM